MKITSEAADLAERHVRDILSLALEYASPQKALIVFDRQCELAGVLSEAYRRALPKAEAVHFDEVTPEKVLASFETLKPGDLVILVQSSNFRLNDFRIRVELFKRGLKVIEHPHLNRMEGDQVLFYIDSLAYDPKYYRAVGKGLKERLDQAREGVIDSGGETLVFSSGFESAKLNVGDYSGMKNIGGQFPIGEVFTEAKDLEAVNGQARIFAFGDTSFKVNQPEKPIRIIVSRGRVTGTADSTPEFDKVLANIRRDEGEVWLRELGFGLNRAFTRERIVNDIGTYERMCGVHLSMGAKHTLYKKPEFDIHHKTARHHIDLFAVTQSVTLDGECVYRDGMWQVKVRR